MSDAENIYFYIEFFFILITIFYLLRELLQGIEPPNEESSKLFDAGTKYHIINNIPFMR